MPSRRRALTAVLAAGVLLLGACDSGSKASSNGAAEATTTSTPRVTVPSALDPALGPPCTVATGALVSEKLGLALTGPNLDQGPTATVCTYDNPSVRSESATIQLQYRATAASFANTRTGFSGHGEQVADVPGLGDEAYRATLAIGNVTSTTLVARKGSTEVLITTTAPADRVPALMTALLALV